MDAVRAYVGESVMIGGFFYEILYFDVREGEVRCVAYSDEIDQEIDLSIEDVRSSMVVAGPGGSGSQGPVPELFEL